MDERMKAFMILTHDAFGAATLSRKYAFESEDGKRPEDKCVAISYAATCVAKYSAAVAIYWTSPDIWHQEIPELFAQFDTFTSEVMTDFATDHSRQWVDIEYSRLKELFENSVCSMPIVE